MAQGTGKVALITGANKGIGFETARQLAQQGYRVLLGARDLAKGQEAASQLKAEGLDVEPIRVDITEPATFATTAQTIEAQ